ncbi:MAG: HAMP domain-containing sensor histidine kinase, partial [Saprospiraceae bacterium]
NNQVEKVLNVARLEKDTIELKKEIFEANDTLRDIINNESLKLKMGSIEYIESKNPVYINADKLHFVNVVANMIDNAIKYSNDKPFVQISLNEEDKNVLLKIRDHGIGIDKENLKKLFDKFYRVSTGNVHDVKGFGLGLFYVKNICTVHGWNIHIDSSPGEGSTFIITIPKLA